MTRILILPEGIFYPLKTCNSFPSLISGFITHGSILTTRTHRLAYEYGGEHPLFLSTPHSKLSLLSFSDGPLLGTRNVPESNPASSHGTHLFGRSWSYFDI